LIADEINRARPILAASVRQLLPWLTKATGDKAGT
jgi:hypothetical protein